jgi:hypothetical protein
LRRKCIEDYTDMGHRSMGEDEEDNKRGTFTFLLSPHIFGSSNQGE